MGGRGSTSGFSAKSLKMATTGYPKLEGTAKQISWAESIRDDAIKTINGNINLLDRQNKTNIDANLKNENIERAKLYSQIGKNLESSLMQTKKASTIIDKRSTLSSYSINRMVEEEFMRRKRKLTAR